MQTRSGARGLPSSVIFHPLLIARLSCLLPLISERPRALEELGNEIRWPDWGSFLLVFRDTAGVSGMLVPR